MKYSQIVTVIKKQTDNPIVRYLIAGTICTIIGTGLMFLMYNSFNVDFWLSSALNYGVGGVIGYFLNKHYTFGSKGHSLGEALRYFTLLIASYVVSFALAKYAIPKIFTNITVILAENIAMIVGTMIYSVLFYCGMRMLVFPKVKTQR